jgi:hypothetical protein
MCQTIVDPTAGWFKMVELPALSQLSEKDITATIKWTTDKLSAEVARLFHQQQLSHCPGAKCITYDN